MGGLFQVSKVAGSQVIGGEKSGRNVNSGRLVAMKFYGISNNILEQLAHLVKIDFQDRQWLKGDFCLLFQNQGLNIVESSFEDIIHISCYEPEISPAHPG